MRIALVTVTAGVSDVRDAAVISPDLTVTDGLPPAEIVLCAPSPGQPDAAYRLLGHKLSVDGEPMHAYVPVVDTDTRVLAVERLRERLQECVRAGHATVDDLAQTLADLCGTTATHELAGMTAASNLRLVV